MASILLSILSTCVVILFISSQGVFATVNRELVTLALNAAKVQIWAKCFKAKTTVGVVYNGPSMQFHGTDGIGASMVGSEPIPETQLENTMKHELANKPNHEANKAAVACAFEALKKGLATKQTRAGWELAVNGQVDIVASCKGQEAAPEPLSTENNREGGKPKLS